MNVGSEGGGGQDFDLNLAPIIDCFTVLITYLLVSASFLSLSIFDVGVAASGQAAPSTSAPVDPPVSLAIELGVTKKAELKLTGGKEHLELTIPVPPLGGSQAQWDLETLTQKIEQFKTKYPTLVEASISAEPMVQYKEVVTIVESLKKTLPKVFLAD